ncbi:MAG: carboxypeptidase regulatory-like domain-containing protein [Candidatus Paceibacterota bacterium]
MQYNNKQKKRGFTLVEMVITIAVFSIVSITVYASYVNILEVVTLTRQRTVALALVNEQIESIRNLPYSDVGVPLGIPDGVVPHKQVLERNGTMYHATTTIRNVDDPFDGVIGGTPDDLSPADYKLIEIEIGCPQCKGFTPIFLTSRAAPKGLETNSSNGALFVRVFDGSGVPIQGANVHIENNAGSPIVVDDVTDSNGAYQLVDAPPGSEVWEISVSKGGYTSDRTYEPDSPENPDPIKPHATVVVQSVTQVSFVIDEESIVELSTVNNVCSPISYVDFSMEGTKLVGNPDVFKFSTTSSTDSSGQKMYDGLDWDTYSFEITDAGYDLVGSSPVLPVELNPGSTQNVQLILEPSDPQRLLVTVKDGATGLPLTDVEVELTDGASYTESFTTGQGFIRQTDWSGGPGQSDFVDPTMYATTDGRVDTDAPVGEMKLDQFLGAYETSGFLVSSTFDTGGPTNFYNLLWTPLSQPPGTGADSVKFQVASNNDNATWNFLGPDGASTTFYTVSDANIHSLHDSDQYFRYKAYLSTASTTLTPNVSDVFFTFTSACTPPGQVSFGGLLDGVYTITASRPGYQTWDEEITIDSSWMNYTINLMPN